MSAAEFPAALPCLAWALRRALACLLLAAAAFVVLPAGAQAQTTVPTGWALKPAAVAVDGEFRLIFATSSRRNAQSTNINDYNTFVQNLANNGHSAIQAFSSGFRVVGCTSAVDARDNTSTTYTDTDKGVPIYWLNGNKVADDYEDFYDASWDDEASPKNESGNDETLTSSGTYPFTGCKHNGTEDLSGGESRALGATGENLVRLGAPNDSGTNSGPLASNFVINKANERRFYGLSEVFQVKEIPTISSVAVTSTPISSRNGYGAGEKIKFTVTFSEAVEVTGAPHFEFSLGPSGGATDREAAYESGSGTTELVFSYTVQSGDRDPNGIWIGDQTRTLKLDSGEYIRSASTMNDAWLNHDGLGTQSDHKVNGDNTTATGKPTIRGPAQVGQMLTANEGNIDDDNGLPTTTFPVGYTFQWVRVDGGTESDISGATSRTYTPTPTDEGKTIKVKVSFIDGGGTTETLTSDESATVLRAAESCTSRTGNDWCTTMTVGESGTASGFRDVGIVTYGSLDKTTIDYGPSFKVLDISLVWPNSPSTRYITTLLNAYPPVGTVFDLGGTEFTADADSRTSSHGENVWLPLPSGFTRWLDGQKVTVSANFPPLLESATVGETSLVLTYAEDLDTGSVPAASAYTVTVDGTAVTVSSVAISGNKVTLTLATAVTQGQTVTVSYTPPASGAVRDVSDIEAPGLTNHPVVVDPRGAVLIPDALEVGEGTTESYTIALTDAPTGTVTVTITGAGAGVELSRTRLTFTPVTWAQPQRVEVTTDEDDNAVDEEVTLAHTPSGGGYDGVSLPDIVVTVADNDGGIVAVPTALTVAEGDSESYGVTLTRRPTSVVTVTVTWDGEKVEVVPSPMAFNADTWNTPRAVTVIGLNDADKNDETVTLRHTATGGGYTVGASDDALNAPVKVTVQDSEATAPEEPQNLEAGAGNESALLRWDPPGDNGGAPVTGYEYRQGTDGTPQATDSLSRHTVRGLTNGTEYRFQVRAVNRLGAGPWSAAKTVVPVPLMLTVEALDDEVDEGEPVRYRIVMSERTDWIVVNSFYRVEGDFMRGTGSGRSSGGIRSHRGSLVWEVEHATVDDNDVEAHGSFTVELTPGDGYALGTPSSATVQIRDNDGGELPGAPPGLTLSAVSAKMLDATWRAAAANGAPLTGYAVAYREFQVGPGGWTRWPETIAPEARSVRLAGLSPGTDYQVRVRAENVRGEGPWSAVISDSTPPDPGVEVWIERGPSTLKVEGATLLFTVRSSVPELSLRVDLRVTETVDVLAPGAPTSVTIPAGQRSVAFEVRTRDDAADEGDSEVTAELQPGVRYTLGEARAATYTVRDNEADDPERGRVLRPRVEAILDPRTPEYVQEELRAAGEAPWRVLRFAWDPPSDVALAHVFGWEVQHAEAASCSQPPPAPEGRWPGRSFWLVEELERLRGGTQDLVQVREAAHIRVRAQLVGTRQPGPWTEPVCGDMAAFATAQSGASATRAPSVTSVAVAVDPDANGVWSPGEAVTVTVEFSDAVTVWTGEGTPSVSLLAGGAREAVYAGGTGTAALRFVYEVTAADGTVSSVLVPANALKLNGGAIEGPTGLAAVLTHSGAARVGTPPRGPPSLIRGTDAPLTASFENLPAQHDGKTPFEFNLVFNQEVYRGTEPVNKNKAVRQAFTVTEGRVTGGRRLVKTKFDVYVIKVKPAGHETVTIRLEPSSGACTTASPTCTPDGIKLGKAIESDVAGPVTLSVSGDTVQEGPEAVLEFAVTLSRTAEHRITVDYETFDGSAKAGIDYVATSDVLTFEPGETKKTIRVAVLDDAIDEGTKTMRLVLSDADGGYIVTAEAIGIIDNSDPMPQAWLSRFGRTVGSQVVEAVSRRVDGSPPASHLNLGGIPFGDAPLDDADPLTPHDRLARQMADRQAAQPLDERTLTGRDVLLGSSFHLVSQAAEDGGAAWSAWGRVSSGGFQAEADGTALDGDVVSGLLGVDAQWRRLLAGVLVLHSEADGGYRLLDGGDAGTIESTLTGVYPYARLRLGGRLSVWAAAGLGSGDLRLMRAQETLDTGLDVRLGALGAQGALAAIGGVDLAVKSDVLWVRTASDAVPGGLASSSAAVNRLRLIVEGGRRWALSSGAVLSPRVQVGLRHDGGDAERGTGVEVGAGLGYRAGMLRVEAQVRTLLAHAAAGYEEWGASGLVQVSPQGSGLGPSLTVSPSWGTAVSGVGRLWSQPDASSLVAVGETASGRVEAELGWGVSALRGRGVLTPYARMALAEGAGGSWHLGSRLSLSESLALSLEGSRRQSGGETAHDLTLHATLPW